MEVQTIQWGGKISVLHVASSTSDTREYPSVLSNPLFVNYRLTMRLVYRSWVEMPG